MQASNILRNTQALFAIRPSAVPCRTTGRITHADGCDSVEQAEKVKLDRKSAKRHATRCTDQLRIEFA